MLFTRKSSGNHRFSDDFERNGTWLIGLNSLIIRCETWRQSLKVFLFVGAGTSMAPIFLLTDILSIRGDFNFPISNKLQLLRRKFTITLPCETFKFLCLELIIGSHSRTYTKIKRVRSSHLQTLGARSGLGT